MPRRSLVYLGMFLVSVGAVVGLQESGAIDGGTGFLLFLVAMVPLLLSARTMIVSLPKRTSGWPIARYTRGLMIAMSAYVVGLGAANLLERRFDPTGIAAVGLALLPVLPIFYMIYVIGRYLMDETDEYLRYRSTLATLFGLALVLGFGTFWGFLEGFADAPHLRHWAVPVWAVGMGVAQAWLAFRDRAGSVE